MNRGRERENQFTQFDQRPETVAASSTREMLPITNNAVCMTIHAHAHSNNNVTLVSMNNDTRLCEPNRSMAPLLCNASKRRPVFLLLLLFIFSLFFYMRSQSATTASAVSHQQPGSAAESHGSAGIRLAY